MDRRTASPTTTLAIALVAGLFLAGCVTRTTAPETLPAAEPDSTEEAQPSPGEFTAWIEPIADEDQDVADVPAVEDPTLTSDTDTDYASEPVSESPLDRLADVDPQPAEDELERNRDLVVDEAPTFDIPMEVNDRVLAWVERYSVRHRESFEAGLRRSGRYMDRFREIFAEEGLPRDLVYMAHVESGYKTSAYSRAHARGIFQFIAATGRRYGLRVDYWADERADPEKSARAAAHYMRDLYEEFDDWYLAFAAYNAGEGKVRRAIARTGTRDFWAIAETRYLRRETKNHIPAILAATLLSKEPGKYGLTFVPDPPLEYDTIGVRGAADLRVLARCAGTDLDTMRRLNPALRRSQTPPDGEMDVHVPQGTAEATVAALEAIPTKERVLYARYRVKSGDTLSTIARAYRVSVHSIQQVNGMGRRTLIRVNQTLLVPTSSAGRYADLGSGIPTHAVPGEALTYRIRRGDTLYAIARRYDTTPRSIASASSISVNKTLHPGQRLTVVPGARSPDAARRIATGGTAAADSSGRVVHTVRGGDTLWRIANLYRTTVNTLCRMNDISRNTTLYPGVKLTVGYR